ncbi:MAG: hypothetical protein ABI743_15225, partial [bacterium]
MTSGFARGLAAPLFTAALLALSTLVPAAAAPFTADSLGATPPADWQTLARDQMHVYDLPESGLKFQCLVFTTDLVHSLQEPLMGDATYPKSAIERLAIANAIKPQSKSVLVYIAARDRSAKPPLWSPVFEVGAQSFAIRLTEGGSLPAEKQGVVERVGLQLLASHMPMDSSEAWRG